LIFLDELSVNISDHVISNVVSNYDFFKLSKFSQLKENLFIEVFEVIDSFNQSFLRYIKSISKGYCSWRVVIKMRQT